jgi:hypothetical protein
VVAVAALSDGIEEEDEDEDDDEEEENSHGKDTGKANQTDQSSEEVAAAAAAMSASRLVTATGRPYHFGTHYSSSATVLHYLLRLQPYASAHVHFQGCV